MKDFVRKLLLLVCACVFVYSAYQLALIYFEYNQIEKDTENLVVDYVEEPVINNTQNNDEKPKEENRIDPLKRVIKFSDLLKKNSDVIGWIYIPGTKIDEPLLKGENNNSYLHTNVNKKKSSAGAIFIDEGNDKNLLDSNTIIHGHNMKNGSRFHNLRYFIQKSYYQSHPNIYIYLPDGNVNIYELYASDKISAYSNLYTTNVDYASYIKSVQKGASQKTKVSTSASPLIILSTCYDSGSDDRYAVFARLKENVKVN